MYKTIIKLAAILILAVVILPDTALAQNKNGDDFAPVGFYNGAETSEGTLDLINSMRWGNTLVMVSYGEWETYHLTVSYDYFLNKFNPSGGFVVTSGSWSLISYRGAEYEGTLYGNVVGGELRFLTDNSGEITSKSTRLNLRVTGGTGRFDSKDARNTIFSLQSVTDTRSHQTNGNAFLPF